ncbi:SigE family RNA polymerase sigma factor [Ornithinimicrobium sp. Y1694]|uniref:SigE family RNA polymerase sigma factor n=1 Tax=Ornithinimicrobium sp. Y1694 TaxID=3418590 RepID=UPI003CF7E145
MRQADEDSFVEFATQAKPWLLSTAWMLTGDRHVAEDLVQETLVRLYLKWRTVQDGQPSAYARRTLVNLRTDRWRRTRREVVGDPLEEAARHTDLGAQTLSADLVSALQTLPARERECVVYRHYLDLTERATADALGISVGSVKGYTSRGLAALRPMLKEADHV